jgi:hypothetical protein
MRRTWRLAVRRILLILVGLLVIVVAWPVYILGVAFGLWQPISRPRGVSASARYVSSIEDGTWFDCSVDLARNVNICKAWGFDGSLLADGEFRLEGTDRAATKAELRPSSVVSSGGQASMIYLFGKAGAESGALVPVNGRRPHSAGCKWDPATNRLACD